MMQKTFTKISIPIPDGWTYKNDFLIWQEPNLWYNTGTETTMNSEMAAFILGATPLEFAYLVAYYEDDADPRTAAQIDLDAWQAETAATLENVRP
jgi:hypothetical protein